MPSGINDVSESVAQCDAVASVAIPDVIIAVQVRVMNVVWESAPRVQAECLAVSR